MGRCVALLALLGACGGDAMTGDAAGSDGGSDARADSALDSGVDARPPDAASDASAPDAGADGALDAPTDASDAGRPDGLLALTMNLRNAFIDSATAEMRLDMVTTLIEARRPDVVALQEVTEIGGEPNLAEQLAARTGYEYVWEVTHEVPFAFNEGIAVLSRGSIRESMAMALPHTELGGLLTRAVLYALVETPLGDVPFFATHLTTDEDDDRKADQAAAVLGFMEPRHAVMPGVLGGDMNAEPDRLAMRVLRGEDAHMGIRGDLVDSWAEVAGGDPGPTFPSDAPERRIDYLYAVPGTDASWTVVSCERVLTEPEGTVYASDHVGVLCLFE